MHERPRPDLEQTREALRQHDERVEEPVEDDDATPDADEPEPASDDSRE